MFGFLKNMCASTDDLKTRQKKAIKQDQKVRDHMTEKQIDKGLKDSMDASDPVSKY